MPKEKLPKKVSVEAKKYLTYKSAAAEATSTMNKQKTVLRNVVKDLYTREKLNTASYMCIDGARLSYEATKTSVINPEGFLALYEDGEISKEQFLSCLKVNIAPAENVIGGDQVASLKEEIVGATVDLRIVTLPVEYAEDKFLMRGTSSPKRRKRLIRATTVKTGRNGIKRNIKVKRR